MTADRNATDLTLAAVSTMLRTGAAEPLGCYPGDPVYVAGHFWHLGLDEADTYVRVVDPGQVNACAIALQRLRAARQAAVREQRW